MLIRLALISLVLAIWLVMPHSTEDSEMWSDDAEIVPRPPPKTSLEVNGNSSPTTQTPSEKRKANKKKRLKKKRRKEKRRKSKDKRRKRRKGRKGSKKRKDRPRRKKNRMARRRRRKNKRKNRKNKKNKNKYKKRKRKGAGRRDKFGKRRGNARIRRGRRKRGRPCKTDSDCKANQCCQGEVCIRPGRGLKCFGSCMCKARKKTKNFICVTKKKKMLAHFRKYGNETEKVPRGHCRNITLTELEKPSQKFIEIKAPIPKVVAPVPSLN